MAEYKRYNEDNTLVGSIMNGLKNVEEQGTLNLFFDEFGLHRAAAVKYKTYHLPSQMQVGWITLQGTEDGPHCTARRPLTLRLALEMGAPKWLSSHKTVWVDAEELTDEYVKGLGLRP